MGVSSALHQAEALINEVLVANTDGWGNSRLGYFTDEAAPSIISALMDAGWSPPGTKEQSACCGHPSADHSEHGCLHGWIWLADGTPQEFGCECLWMGEVGG